MDKYALAKLGLAIDKMTIGENDIKSRLRDIFGDICAIKADDFPNELKKDWESIYNRLNNKESKYKGTEYDKGSFEATMYRMHKKTASKIASDIVNLYDRFKDFEDQENT